MEFDIRTLSFVATVANFLMFLALGTLWWINRQEKGPFFWMIGALGATTGFMLIGFRHYIPPFMSIILANMLILGGFQFQCIGVFKFLRKSAREYYQAALFAFVALGFLYFTYFEPNTVYRIILISWAVSLISILAAYVLIVEYLKEHSVPKFFLASVFAIYGVFMAFRGFYTLFESTIPDFMSAGAVHAISLLVFIALSISLSIGFSVLVSARLNSELVSELELRDRIFSIIAHDLRSPFSVLVGYTGIFQELSGQDSHEKQIEYAKTINDTATNALELVDNLLIWSLAQSKNEEVDPESLSLREMAEIELANLLPRASEKQLRIVNQTSDDVVYTDRNMIRTVLRNLISNAIKFAQHESDITIESKASNNKIELSVQNIGPEIPEMYRDTIFDAGTKTTSEGTAGEKGTGLGLPLCRDLLRKISGSIELDTSFRNGTRLVVTLPQSL